MTRPIILGTGSSLPERILTNRDLEKMVDTSDEWITTRTGIKTRRIAAGGEETSRLAAAAGKKAMEMAGVTPDEIDLIIVGTMTSEMAMPSCSCFVQKELGAGNAFAFDVNAACSGFVYGLDTADKYLRCKPDLKALIIGAENLSARVNWKDRNTCILFGDGAGACVLATSDNDGGILASRIFSNGRLSELLMLDSAPSMNPDLNFKLGTNNVTDTECDKGACIRMKGKDVFKFAVRAMAGAVTELLGAIDIPVSDVDLLIPHQANIRILKGLADRLHIPFEKIFINLHKYGNTSAASIPIALDEANREGRLKKGDLLVLCAMGGGFTWGTTIIRW